MLVSSQDRRRRFRCLRDLSRLIGGVHGICLMMPAGCAVLPPAQSGDSQERMVAMLMPARIEIVEPFTRVCSFDQDDHAEGIEVLVQVVNALGDPGRRMAGKVRIELYDFVPASAERRGRLIESWEVDVSTPAQQERFWNPLTQMYEFRLAVDPTRIHPKSNFVLQVTYTSPLGEHLTDNCLIEYRAVTGPLGGVRTRSP